MKRFIILVLLIVHVSLVNAQSDCGFAPTNKEISIMDKMMSASKGFDISQRGAKVSIPVKFHLVRRDDGSGGITQAQATSILKQVNTFYGCTDISFVQRGNLNFIDDTDNYAFNSSNENAFASRFDIPKVINLYFFGSLVSGGSPLCGYTRFPPSQDRVFLAYSCVTGGNTTLEHELGHYFTLFHTHGTTNTGTTDELVDGSNCATAGNRLCDTPADPNLSGKVNSSCQYTGTATDANGQQYNPDVRNVMAYSLDKCGPFMSEGQCDRIRDGFERGRSYLDFSFEEFGVTFTANQRDICVDNKVQFTGNSLSAQSWFWEFEGGTPSTSTRQNPEVEYNFGGSFRVKVTVTRSGQSASATREKYISVIDPDDGAEEVEFNTNLDSEQPLLNFFTVKNPDEGFTFEYSAVDKLQDANSGSVFLNNFAYDSDAIGNVDELHFPYFDFDGVKKYDVSFDYSYRPLEGQVIGNTINPNIFDSLYFYSETVCGTTNAKELWKMPYPLSPTLEPHIPTNSSEWRTVNLKLDKPFAVTTFALFYFKSISNNGNNLYIDNISITPDYSVSAPFSLTKVEVLPSSVRFRWNHEGFSELGFAIERATDGGDFEVIDSVSADIYRYTDTSVSEGSNYKYRVFAFTKFDNRSGYSNVVTVEDFVTDLVSNRKFGLKVYPNPSEGKFLIDISNTNRGILSVSVVDLVGRVIHNQSFEKNSDKIVENIELQNLNEGIYFLKMQIGNSVTTNKIRIVR